MVDPLPEQAFRREPRLYTINLVSIERFDEDDFRADAVLGRTIDLSQGGIRVEMDHPLPLKSRVALSLALENDVVELEGMVRHLEMDERDRIFVGIKFLDPTDEQRERIAQFLETHYGG